MNKITDKFWDFIEKYLPNYHSRDDVLRQGFLQNYIDGHESPVQEEGITRDEAEDELHHLLYNIYFEAIDAYTKELGTECQDCESTDHFSYCPICGKKHP